MSFYASQGSQPNGVMMQLSSSSRQFEGAPGINPVDNVPQIYTAVYSTVEVYEMEVNGIAVMRRRKDSWLNATQILKVAGIEKGKRTKVLEKEILTGEHEKVQGGYGKYQGTWVKFERGFEFCKQYGVEELLRPLLTYDMGQDGSVAGGGAIDTPTKEQAMAAQRKRLYNASVESRPSSQSGVMLKNIISTASHAVAAINKARFDSPGPRMRNSNTSRLKNLSKNSLRQQQQQHLNSQSSSFSTGITGLEQGSNNFHSSENFSRGHEISSCANSFTQQTRDNQNPELDEPPRKRVRPSPNMISPHPKIGEEHNSFPMRELTPSRLNQSLSQHSQQDQFTNSLILPLPPLQAPINTQLAAKKDLLMSLFTSDVQKDFSKHKAFESLDPDDLDIPIDASSNTALMWAATLARVELLGNLIIRGASIFRVNSAGETALMRSCLVTNNLEAGSFPKLLELLSPTIEMRDSKGRTVLHHIAIASAVKGRSQASKYYLESLLEFVVRGSNTTNNQKQITNGQRASQSIGIGRFMSEIVNMQDSSGDTALMIASRIGNRSIISQLIEVGADISIPNKSNLTPADFGVGDVRELDIRRGDRTQDDIPLSELKENSKDIISSITNLLEETRAEFSSEMNKKQAIIDDLHSKLRNESSILGQRRRLFETLQSEQNEVETRNFKISNLCKALNEEKSKLSQLSQQQNQKEIEELFKLGDADKDFKIPKEALETISSFNLKENLLPLMTDDETKRIDSLLPSLSVLRARVNAYNSINKDLEKNVLELKSKDSELTRKYRKIISLCTGIEEDRVDDSISSLVRSLESEHDDVELSRVRKFLSRVEAV
ncbi:putative start control protein cdc10 [Erysiphe necator]|uniref:Transcription factor SWI6 n=1 Tax=Uncinula necator TaxID=52586 RepID=A0A0B1P007_UNCNE|nr:putative start control protein cdc10 [Erysiphe necator]